MNQSALKKLNCFFSKGRLINLKKGEVILRADEENIYYVYYLQLGFVRQYSISTKGEEVIINIFRPHSFFPIIYVINNFINRFTFEAMTAVEIRRMESEKVVSWLKLNPDILFELTCRLGKGLDATTYIIEHMMNDCAQAKVINALAFLYKRYGEPYGKKQIIIKIPMTHRCIGSYFGLSRETVSREIEKIQKKGLISKIGKYYVLSDWKKFNKLIS